MGDWLGSDVRSLRLVLASRSPRRRELLTLAGYRFDVMPADIDESVRPGEDPMAYVERVASAKAAAVRSQRADAVVLAADTTVALDSAILGKPVDEHDAARMLRLLAGRTHQVHTAVAVCTGERRRAIVVSTDVTFDALTDADIATYVGTGEPLDKAGAYAIQGFGGVFVRAVNGSVTNVIGLPLVELRALLHDVAR